MPDPNGLAEVVFHNCKEDISAMVVSGGGELATPSQLSELVVILNRLELKLPSPNDPKG